MKIPGEFEAILTKDLTLHAGILQTLNDFGVWLRNNNVVFFQDFTDHSDIHIENVLQTAATLIAQDSFAILGPKDIAVLVIGILLHDSAMHLQSDGFLSLRNGSWPPLISNPRSSLTNFGRPWPELWADFIGEAKRFDERKLRRVFGDVEPTREPPASDLDWTERDRRLIGEFIRRWHTRLAHEIAIFGVPGTNLAAPLSIADSIPHYLRDLAGHVARSHGISIRGAVDEIPKAHPTDTRRAPHGIYVPFLMAVIRVADYLQINSDRAPELLLKLRSLKSPLSKEEWLFHHSIDSLHREHEDPEAIFVSCSPSTSREFFKIADRLDDMQGEVDSCWALLGEIYGRDEKLQKLRLNLRRIRSNLDDVEMFAAGVDYLPVRASFEASSPDLLRLLVAPLYGNHPVVGVRELVQNATDACRELQDHTRSSGHGPRDPEPAVTVTLNVHDDGTGTLIVCDTGIGMTADTILNYFLRAGASFRNSDIWKKLHTDAKGHSRVLRSGRFGIGVLAAFLLGDSVEVETRHVTSPTGIGFNCTLETDHIELNRIASATIGTKVTIKVSQDVIQKLTEQRHYRHDAWDWWCLKQPVVLRQLRKGDEIKELPQHFDFPAARSPLTGNWRRINVAGYDDIVWMYTESTHVKAITCNGILISDSYGLQNSKISRFMKVDSYPTLNIFDSCALLPLSITRDRLSSDIPWERELLRSICFDIAAYVVAVSDRGAPWSNNTLPRITNYPGFQSHSYSQTFAPSGLAFTSNGVYPLTMRLVRENLGRILVVNSNSINGKYRIINEETDFSISHARRSGDSLDDLLNCIQFVVEKDQGYGFSGHPKPVSACTLVSNARYIQVSKRFSNTLARSMKTLWTEFGWRCLTRAGSTPPEDSALREIAERYPLEGPGPDRFLLLDYGSVDQKYKGGMLDRVWLELFGDLKFIPYSMPEKDSIISKTVAEFPPMVANWRDRIDVGASSSEEQGLFDSD